ncbi:MAG: SPOR domain-containing protein [Blastocatellia bacterium]
MRFILRASLALSALLFLAIVANAQSGKFTVQIVAAESQAEADAKVKELKAKGIEAYILKSQVAGKGTFYRVRAGSFTNASDARKYGETLKQQGFVPDFFIAPYERPTELSATLKLPASEPAKPAAKTPPPAPAATKESTAKEPVKTAPPVKEAVKEPAAKTPPLPPPVASSAISATPAISFAQFKDSQIGFSFQYPAHWTGNPVNADAAQAQRVNAGAYFQSVDDNAFMNVIWNELDKANNPANNNDLIVDVILNSMKSGKETQSMEATSRRLEEAKGQIKTYLELQAKFRLPGQDGLLDFMGKALIVRANKGILLIAVFYSKDAPTHVPGLADKVLASVKTPE